MCIKTLMNNQPRLKILTKRLIKANKADVERADVTLVVRGSIVLELREAAPA
jgi:hypothetical protein